LCDRHVVAGLPLLAKALPWVGHAATRHRGTIGGSVAAVLAARADLDAVDDLHASAAYRKRVAATLARRAILAAKVAALGGPHTP
jgi:CO/xanthine dehydrogenase FAD-binding subunit